MDFDFNHIAVPFRMQPGLRRLTPDDALLTPLTVGSALYLEKQAVARTGACFLQMPGFDPDPALAAIKAHAAAHGIATGTLSGESLPLAFEEDLAVLDGTTERLAWMCICTPSHWAPEDKIGLDFAAVHAPVADNRALIAAAHPLVLKVTDGGAWERFVWTVSPSPRHDQHPLRQPRTPWPPTDNADDFARQCYLRVERQCFLPVERSARQAVFTIRVMLAPLADVVATPHQAHRLHEALASMSEAVLAYKNLSRARSPLLQWLKARGA